MAGKGGKREGAGRKKGTTNEITQMLKASLSRVGGIEYLVKQSEENPVAYMGMISKLLPRNMDITSDGEKVNLSFNMNLHEK